MKQKLVFSDISEVAHLWANATQYEARNSGNFYYTGCTIFSYGSHFPIATLSESPHKEGVFCLMTLGSYSNSTAKHINAVCQANWREVIYMAKVPQNTSNYTGHLKSYFDGREPEFHNKNIDYWIDNIRLNIGKIESARKKEIYISAIQKEVKEIEKYLEFFGLTKDPALTELLNNANPETFTAYLQAEEARIKKAAADKLKAHLKWEKEQVKKFRKFEIKDLKGHPSGFNYLRYNKAQNEVQTSLNVVFSVDIAKAFYNVVKSVIAKGGCKDGSCTDKFMHQFEVREINKEYIIVGCHKIAIKEIEKIYTKICK